MEVHHSGEFREKPNKVYIEGHMDCINDCDVNLMSLIEMDDIASTIGYAPYIGYYYRILDGDVSVDKGKRVRSKCDELDSEYQLDSESSDYDFLVDNDYENE
ncbi:unnamed protein product [Ilex paraguariensis]|uniref:PB1-like domain-containing protein n=1 Tax=Ilex paraguariensis TaxID=185542 RepID=A0ABC8RLV3_9AQUA